MFFCQNVFEQQFSPKFCAIQYQKTHGIRDLAFVQLYLCMRSILNIAHSFIIIILYSKREYSKEGLVELVNSVALNSPHQKLRSF